MAIEQQLEEFASSLQPSDDFIEELHKEMLELSEIVEEVDKFSVATVWKTAEIDSTRTRDTVVDAVNMIHTDVSERSIPNVLTDHIEQFYPIQKTFPGVRITHNEIPVHVVATKFATQGSLQKVKEDPTYISDIVGYDQLFRNTSRLLQNWQIQMNLTPGDSGLLPFEIEFTLSEVFRKFSPTSLLDALRSFFDYAYTNRFSKQMNIYDKNNNIIVYHEFKIMRKQDLLVAVDNTRKELAKDNPDLAKLGFA